MAWPQITLRSWDDFLKILETIPKNDYPSKVMYILVLYQSESAWVAF